MYVCATYSRTNFVVFLRVTLGIFFRHFVAFATAHKQYSDIAGHYFLEAAQLRPHCQPIVRTQRRRHSRILTCPESERAQTDRPSEELTD